MSFRLYATRLKCQLRNRANMFWCLMFPIVLSTCYYFAFNNIGKASTFKTINIAYDNQGIETDYLKTALEGARISENKPMFYVTFCDSIQAGKLLDENKIDAYIVGSTNPELFIKVNGLNETIVKSFLDSYKKTASTVHTILADNPDALKEGLLENAVKTASYLTEQNNKKKPDTLLVCFYSLLAFSCLYSAFWGVDEVVNIQADQSSRGARINTAPIHKMKLFLCNLLAAFTIHTFNLLILFVYMKYVLKMDFGDKLGFTLLTCLVGSLTGLFLGATIGIFVKKSVSAQGAILVLVLLVGGFLSGMMFPDMKYIIATKAPFIGYINPVGLISDAFYRLYYYDTYNHYLLDLIILFTMAIVLAAAAYIGIRRRNYESI